MLRRSLPLLALLLLETPALFAAEPRLVPTPRATPIATSATNRPFLAADRAQLPVDLAARGYQESELLVSGYANVYDWAGADLAVVAPAVPYATRVLVRRPKDATKFSGRVVVELLAAGDAYDSAPLWGLSWEYFLRRGDAWVGVTVRPAAVAALRRFDGVRYSRLSFAYRRAACATGAAPEPADAENGLAWDLIAQVGALLRSSSKENPLLQLNPQRLVVAGYAQAAGYVVTYAQALHQQLRLGDGSPVFDAYLDAAGTGVEPVNSCAALPSDAARRLPPVIATPFISVMTESDAGAAAAPPRDDADEPGVYRLYQIAGAADQGPFAAGLPSAADRVIAGQAASTDNPCREPRADFPAGLAFNALWQQLDDLLVRQVPMSREPRLEAGGNGEVARDAQGNALGGLRLPQIVLPLAGWQAHSTPRTDDARAKTVCAHTGTQKPMSVAQLKARYHSRAEYLRLFGVAVDEALKARRLTAEDAAALRLSLPRAVPAF